MEKHRAIPQGYMTVGEIAKKMGITVRTLQYYDKQGLLSPSSESEGGRRLYTDKDIINLYQILSLKHLGFSLDDIKSRIKSFDSPTNMANALSGQEKALEEKIGALSESLRAVKALKEEVLQMQEVNLKKYADIIVSLQMNNELYWMIKYLDDDMLDHVRKQFDKKTAANIVDTLKRSYNEAIKLSESGVSPESEQGQKLAENFWNMVMKFTGGDMSLLPKLMEFDNKINESNDEQFKQHETMNNFITPALNAYFAKLGANPFEGETEND